MLHTDRSLTFPTVGFLYFKLKNNYKMRKLLLGMCFVLIAFVGCDSDSDDTQTETKNYLTIGDVEYILKGGIIQTYRDRTDSGNGVFKSMLFLYSEGVSVELSDYTDGTNWDYKGTGFTLAFEMFSSTKDNFDNTDYVKGIILDNYEMHTYTRARCQYWNNSKIDDSKSESFDGKISVSLDGTEYTITLDDEKIKGTYKGTLLHSDRP